MSFDRFPLAVESRDLSQADKSIKRVSSFPKLSDGFFVIIVYFIIQKLKFCKIEKEDTLIILLSAWDRSRDSTAKRNLSKDM